MNSFEYYNPTRVIFGAGSFDKLGNKSIEYGKKALLIKTTGKLEETGIYERATELLNDAGLEVYYLEGVETNPKFDSVIKGAEICRKENVDIIIGVGGGSSIDCAKAVSFATFVDKGELWPEYFSRKKIATKGLPIGAVSTIGATGSETNTNCTVTNEETQEKFTVKYEFNFPKFAIVDPELHVTVPKYFTACGLADIITHVLEGYLYDYPDTPFQDRFSESIISTIIENDVVLENPDNITARSNIAWCAILAINGLNEAGRYNDPWTAHLIQHDLAAKYDMAHGAGMAVVILGYMRFLKEKSPDKIAQLSKRVFGVNTSGKSDFETAAEGIKKLEEKFEKWELPTTLRDLNIPKDLLPQVAKDTLKNPAAKKLNKNDNLEILKLCY